MKIGFIGLGKMGGAMVERLLNAGHEVVVFNRSRGPVEQAKKKGAIGCFSIDELVKKLDKPRIIWIMVTAGSATEATVKSAAALLSQGDILIDGGNSYYKDEKGRRT
jgi:6-phosphogluconate dehydrogenase